MGYSTALGLAQGLSLEDGIRAHFQSNVYPPIPPSMVPVAVEAVQAVVAGDYDKMIDLQGVAQWKGQDEAPAGVIVDSHRLDAFVDAEVDCGCEEDYLG